MQIGKKSDFPSFGWDNEYGAAEIHVADFEAQSRPVSNQEYLEFIKSGGYSTQKYWSEDGWKWRTFRNAKWPWFWVPFGPEGLHQYKLRMVFEELDFLPPNLPAVVNRHEAQAYCKWLESENNSEKKMSYRLLCEAEHRILRDGETAWPVVGSYDGTPDPGAVEGLDMAIEVSFCGNYL